jgi:hypothetical protein
MKGFSGFKDNGCNCTSFAGMKLKIVFFLTRIFTHLVEFFLKRRSRIIFIFLKEGKDEGFLDGLGVLLEC